MGRTNWEGNPERIVPATGAARYTNPKLGGVKLPCTMSPQAWDPAWRKMLYAVCSTMPGPGCGGSGCTGMEPPECPSQVCPYLDFRLRTQACVASHCGLSTELPHGVVR